MAVVALPHLLIVFGQVLSPKDLSCFTSPLAMQSVVAVCTPWFFSYPHSVVSVSLVF